MKELKEIWSSSVSTWLKVGVTLAGLAGAVLAWKLVVYLIESI